MESKITIRGHPVHPMVIELPLGLLPAAVLADVAHFGTHDPFWAHVAFWLIAGGVSMNSPATRDHEHAITIERCPA